MFKTAKLVAGLALAVLLTTNMWGQGIFATLTGIVTDQSGSVVQGAKVVLKDSQSGSAREKITNAEGYYTFASVPVGGYVLTVEAKGFQGYKAAGVNLGGGERRNNNVTLAVGSTTETIEVSGLLDAGVATLDSGEKSF